MTPSMYRFTDLIESIELQMVPIWLREYVQNNKESMKSDLQSIGSHVINGPNCKITIDAVRKSEGR